MTTKQPPIYAAAGAARGSLRRELFLHVLTGVKWGPAPHGFMIPDRKIKRALAGMTREAALEVWARNGWVSPGSGRPVRDWLEVEMATRGWLWLDGPPRKRARKVHACPKCGHSW